MKLEREEMLDLIRNGGNDELTKVDEVFLNETRWGVLYEYIYEDSDGRYWKGVVEAPGGEGYWVDFITHDVEFVEVTKQSKITYVWEEV